MPDVGRFFNVDPLAEKYDDYTPYQFSSNQPVHAKELEGLESFNDLNKRLSLSKGQFRIKEFKRMRRRLKIILVMCLMVNYLYNQN